VLALQLAGGAEGAEMTQTGAIAMIGRQPFGHVLLVVMAIGLAGYVMWGIVRLVFDPLDRGRTPRGLVSRLGFASSALGYTVLLVGTVRIILGTAPGGPPRPDWTAAELNRPFGAWIVGAIGVIWMVGGGFGEIARGWRADFRRDFALERMSRTERRFAITLGRVGSVTRGIIFTVIGIFLIATALHANPHHASGMDGALLGIARQPEGRILLAAVALGLIVFGLYSMMCARWMRMRDATPASDSSPLSSSST